MNVIRMSNRLVATGAAAALAAAALVGVTGTAANAASVTNTYTCNTPLGAFPITLDSEIPELAFVNTLPAGSVLPGDLANVVNHFTLSAAAYEQLQSVGTSKLGFPDFAATIGDAALLASIADVPTSAIQDNGDGTYSFDANGKNAEAEMPQAGSYQVVSPESFTLVATTGSFGDVSVTCAAASGSAGSYGPLAVTKNASTTSGKPVAKTLKATQVAKMKVAVAGPDFQTPGGKVILKEGAKTLGSAMLNDAGVATVKMGKLKRGKHAVTAFYKGDGYTLKSTSKKIVFKVARR